MKVTKSMDETQSGKHYYIQIQGIADEFEQNILVQKTEEMIRNWKSKRKVY